MSLREEIVSSEDYSRKVWIFDNSGSDRLAIFLDAEFYLDRMNILPILESLPISAAFVSYVDGACRHSDFTCNPNYGQFISENVTNYVQNKLPNVSDHGHLICGLSLSGLAAAHLWLTNPSLFSGVLCQSGSFWWSQEWLTFQLSSLEPRGKAWVSVGDKELDKGVSHPPTDLRQDESQVVACENFARELQRVGSAVHFQTFNGGHDLACWRSELPTALQWLLKS